MAERQHTRVMASVGVLVTIDGKTEACLTTDLSRGGMFVRTRRKPAIGTIADLTVVHADRKLHAKAKVVNVKDNGLGLAFTQSDAGFGDAIRAVMNDLVSGVTRSPPVASEERPARPAKAYWGAPEQSSGWKFWERGPRQCDLVNLTLDGAAIQDGRKPAVGEMIDFLLDDGYGPPRQVASQAKVVRHTQTGFAVQFVGASVEFRQAVSRVRRGKFVGK